MGINSDYGRLGDGVFVQEGKATENAGGNASQSLCLDGANILVYICLHELVKGPADLCGVVYTVILALDELSQMHVIVCVGER